MGVITVSERTVPIGYLRFIVKIVSKAPAQDAAPAPPLSLSPLFPPKSQLLPVI